MVSGTIAEDSHHPQSIVAWMPKDHVSLADMEARIVDMHQRSIARNETTEIVENMKRKL